jgi:hypothetical protein
MQVLFAGLMEVKKNADGAHLTVAPLNFDVYSGLGEPTGFVEAEPLFFARVDGEEGYLAFEEDRSAGRTYMYTGTGFLGSYERLRWYERPTFHGVAIGSILLVFFSAFPAGVLWFIRHRRSARPQLAKSERFTRMGRWSIVATSALSLLFLAAASYGAFLAGGAAAGLPSYTFGANPVFVGMMCISFLVALLAAGLLVLAALLWKKRAGSPLFRFYFSAYVIATIGFVWLLAYWNLLGFRY